MHSKQLWKDLYNLYNTLLKTKTIIVCRFYSHNIFRDMHGSLLANFSILLTHTFYSPRGELASVTKMHWHAVRSTWRRENSTSYPEGRGGERDKILGTRLQDDINPLGGCRCYSRSTSQKSNHKIQALKYVLQSFCRVGHKLLLNFLERALRKS